MIETRTIILGDDGRHVTMGRHSEPTEAEVAAAGGALAAKGIGGWLVRMEGDYYAKRGKLALVMIREIAKPRATFAEAEAAFRAARKLILSGGSR